MQTAIQRRSIIKIPIKQPFDISSVPLLSSNISQTSSKKVKNINPHKYNFIEDFGRSILYQEKSEEKRLKLNELFTLNNSIMVTILVIRDCLYKNVDEFNTKLIKKLVELNNTPGFEEFDYYSDPKRHQMVFFFPLTPMSSCISFPKEVFYFNDLISMSKGQVVKISNFKGIYLFRNEIVKDSNLQTEVVGTEGTVA